MSEVLEINTRETLDRIQSQLAKVYQDKVTIQARVDEAQATLEADIQALKDAWTSEHATDLSQLELTSSDYRNIEKRAKDLWLELYDPEIDDKKTRGALQITESNGKITAIDMPKAIELCEVQAPNLVEKSVNKRKLLKAIQSGVLIAPDDVVTIETPRTVKVLTKQLEALTNE